MPPTHPEGRVSYGCGIAENSGSPNGLFLLDQSGKLEYVQYFLTLLLTFGVPVMGENVTVKQQNLVLGYSN